MLEREHSELSRASRNKKSIFFKRIYHTGSSANELALKAKDDHRSVLQSGRSMIEMLGVLAIIGVLTAGGIAGYGKAMMMWRSNQQKEQIAQILHSFIRLRTELSREHKTDNTQYRLMSILNALGEVPAGLTYRENYLFDKLGNRYSGTYGRNCWRISKDSQELKCAFQLNFDVTLVKTTSALTPSSEGFCENMIYLAKENAQDLNSVVTFWGNKEGEDDPNHWRGYTQKDAFYGTNIKNATPVQIKKVCQECKENSYCTVSLHLKP